MEDAPEILRLKGAGFDTVAKVMLRNDFHRSDTEAGEVLEQWLEISKSCQEMSRYTKESTEMYSNRVIETLTADDALSNHGQAANIDFLFASMFAGIGSPLAIPTTIAHHEDGSASATSNLDDLVGNEKPLDLPRLAKITMAGRAFLVTEKGYMGIGPSTIRPGGLASIFRRTPVPYTLRQHALDSFVLIGDCYIH
jgi:hypothetical protein